MPSAPRPSTRPICTLITATPDEDNLAAAFSAAATFCLPFGLFTMLSSGVTQMKRLRWRRAIIDIHSMANVKDRHAKKTAFPNQHPYFGRPDFSPICVKADTSRSMAITRASYKQPVRQRTTSLSKVATSSCPAESNAINLQAHLLVRWERNFLHPMNVSPVISSKSPPSQSRSSAPVLLINFCPRYP